MAETMDDVEVFLIFRGGETYSMSRKRKDVGDRIDVSSLEAHAHGPVRFIRHTPFIRTSQRRNDGSSLNIFYEQDAPEAIWRPKAERLAKQLGG